MEEGVDLIRRFLRTRIDGQRREDSGWEMQEERIVLPVPAEHDGGYICRIVSPR